MPLLRAFSDKASLQQPVSDVDFRAAWEIRMATMMFCSLDFDGVMHDVFRYVVKHVSKQVKYVSISTVSCMTSYFMF